MPLSLAVPRRQLSSSHPSRSDPSIDPRDSPSARVFIYACKMQGGRDVFNGRLDRSRSRGNFRRCGYIIAARPRVLAYHRHPVPRPPGRNPERGGGGRRLGRRRADSPGLAGLRGLDRVDPQLVRDVPQLLDGLQLRLVIVRHVLVPRACLRACDYVGRRLFPRKNAAVSVRTRRATST